MAGGRGVYDLEFTLSKANVEQMFIKVIKKLRRKPPNILLFN